jgi:4-amino-4-deoxy-L-arabinose transferase-like glycosyltransferase
MRPAPLLFVILCIAVLFAGPGRVGFTDVREARDAGVAREMIQRREPLAPVWVGEAWFEKPVLAYAPEILAASWSHGSAERSREVRAAMALALLLLTASIGARHFGARAGWCAAGVLVSMVALPLAARTDGTQVLGTLLGWAGAAGLADALFGRREGRDLRLVVAYGALGAALVTAGPLPALWPIGGLWLFATLARRPEALRDARIGAGACVMLGLAIPWYGAMIERYGAPFVARAPFFPYAMEPRGAWYSGPLLALSFLVVGAYPWSALVPEAMLHAATWWRFSKRRDAGPRPAARALDAAPGDALGREAREESAAHFFIAMLVAALIPVALYPGPPLPAALPALPAAALLCGRLLDHAFEDADRLARSLRVAARMLAVTGTVLAIALAVVAPRIREAAPELRLLAAVVFGTSWLPALADVAGRRRAAAALFTLPVALGAPIVTARVLPEMEDYVNARSVALALNHTAPRQAPVAVLGAAAPSFRLYAKHNVVPVAEAGVALRMLTAADGHAYVAFTPARESDVARSAGTPLEIVMRTPSLVLARVSPVNVAR